MAPARFSIFGGGRLLVISRGWAWVTMHAERPRRLARADAATFSAFGRYVAVAEGSRLAVHALDGRLVWSLDASERVHAVRWAPDGLRVAYRTGGAVRVVDGNGERARTVGRAVGGAVAWRPGPQPVLAYLRARRVLVLVDVATGAELARVRAPAGLRALTWSADGRRLALVGGRELRVVSARGAPVRRSFAAVGERFVDAAFAPRGRRLAVMTRRYGVDRVVLGGRELVRATQLGSPVWSPGGQRLLVPGRNRWILYRAGRHVAPRLLTPPLQDARILGWRPPPT